MDVVVVESPAKAKSINRYLGSNYKVVASYGHIRDLPPQDGSVLPDQDFSMDWSVDPRAQKRITEIADAARSAEHLYLATDPDREGEAIAWHVLEVLKERKAIRDIDVKRVVFNEVTKQAVTHAIANPRDLDQALIDAYLARRALDYLFGFNLSPVLWRKLPGPKSAGRVQSVALRLISERESEIEDFKAQEYWTIDGEFLTPGRKKFSARLTHLHGRKLGRHGLENKEAADNAVAEIVRHDPPKEAAGTDAENRGYVIRSVERKTVRRHPSPPFTTSTLQQEASRKLRMSASQTMRTAQSLYEGVDIAGDTVGLITYMRTDSVIMSQEAVVSARAMIGSEFDHTYVPQKPNVYRSKAKNAQEAHEAIRPTDFSLHPRNLAGSLSKDELRLYELVWKRALASQMEDAVLDQTTAEIVSPGAEVVFRATGSVIKFDGFMRLYMEGKDDRETDEKDDSAPSILPPMSKGDAVERIGVTPEQHFTKPPPRFTEASLVKRLEELGIGRPSTYASILQVLQDRNYVKLESRRFVPSDLGRLVTAFLTEYFQRYVENDFTAKMEDGLDDVSNGKQNWRTLLSEFWKAFSKAIEGTEDLRTRDVIDSLDRNFAEHFFPERDDGRDPRLCPACGTGRLGLKPKAFIGCSNYPECRFTSPLSMITDETADEKPNGPRDLGTDPETGLAVTVRNGPFGPYVQLGEAEKGKKPKRQSLLKGTSPDETTLEQALALLSLPREIGIYPDTGEMIAAGVGRYGPYLKMGKQYVNLREDNVLSIGLNRAISIIADASTKKPTKRVLKALGTHPEDGAPLEVLDGRYGPYVKHGRINATIPKGEDPASVTLNRAVELIAEKKNKSGSSTRAGSGKRKSTSTTRKRKT